VPIDPSAPASRIELIIRDCGLRHLITNSSRATQALGLAGAGLECVIGASGIEPNPGLRIFSWADVEATDKLRPAVQITGMDLAYIMYTSGSTGVPKGLMHTHESGLAYARLSARTYGVGPDDRLGNHSPLHFDMSTFEYLTGPLCGATSVIIPEETTMFPVSLAALIEGEKLTFWYSVPLALIQLLTHGGIEERDASSLRWVLFGGEPFSSKHLRRLMDLWPQARFSNSYGPAEVNQCTYFHLPPGELVADEPVPLGRIWDGAEGIVVDVDDESVTPGQPGELLVRAPTMMRGYWGRPDLNAAAFFIREPVQGFQKVFYRTGDLVREKEDGNLVFLGRKDRQIKIRGYRVELDEVENVLTALEDVVEAAVIARREDDGNCVIMAAVRLDAGAVGQAEELRQHAAGRLPVYAVPSRLEIVTEFPRTGSGKIDRRAVAESC
jgi:amino acid adenylation domain-containing protein